MGGSQEWRQQSKHNRTKWLIQGLSQTFTIHLSFKSFEIVSFMTGIPSFHNGWCPRLKVLSLSRSLFPRTPRPNEGKTTPWWSRYFASSKIASEWSYHVTILYSVRSLFPNHQCWSCSIQDTTKYEKIDIVIKTHSPHVSLKLPYDLPNFESRSIYTLSFSICLHANAEDNYLSYYSGNCWDENTALLLTVNRKGPSTDHPFDSISEKDRKWLAINKIALQCEWQNSDI